MLKIERAQREQRCHEKTNAAAQAAWAPLNNYMEAGRGVETTGTSSSTQPLGALRTGLPEVWRISAPQDLQVVEKLRRTTRPTLMGLWLQGTARRDSGVGGVTEAAAPSQTQHCCSPKKPSF